MHRASIKIEVKSDGHVLAEREFCQEDQVLEDLENMFLTTIFDRMQSLGEDVFNKAQTEKERLEEEAQTKKKGKKTKKAAKKSSKTKQPKQTDAQSDDQQASEEA